MTTHPYTRFFAIPSAPTVDEDETEGYEVGDVVFSGGSFYDCSDTTAGAAVWTERGAGGASAWGDLTGTLADQTDLQTALDDRRVGPQINAASSMASSGSHANDKYVVLRNGSTITVHSVTETVLAEIMAFQLDGIFANYVHTHTGDYVQIGTATVDPTVNDDVTMGYEVPMLWVNTVTNVPWILVDNADGAAVWQSLNVYTQDEVDSLFDGLNGVYAPIAKGVTNGDTHNHNGGDGAQIDHTTASNVGTNTHAQIDTFISTTAPATYAPIAKGVTNGDSHNHVGGDGAVLYYSEALGNFLANSTVPASSTRHTAPWKDVIDTGANNVPLLEGGVLSYLSVRLSGAQPASGSLVVTLYVNSVATAIVVTIPLSSGQGTYQDTTHTVNVNAGDLVRWELVNNATAASGTLACIQMKLTKPTA